jgi:hypothetical protein
MAEPEIVAYRQFVDGSMRPIYDDGKRQWVVNDDRDHVYGVWYIPREETLEAKNKGKNKDEHGCNQVF